MSPGLTRTFGGKGGQGRETMLNEDGVWGTGHGLPQRPSVSLVVMVVKTSEENDSWSDST